MNSRVWVSWGVWRNPQSLTLRCLVMLVFWRSPILGQQQDAGLHVWMTVWMTQSSRSKTILGFWTLFSLLKRFHFLSQRLTRFSIERLGFYSYAYCPPWCWQALLKWWIVLVIIWCWMWMTGERSEEGSWDVTWLAALPSASSSLLWRVFQVNKEGFFSSSFQPSFFSV